MARKQTPIQKLVIFAMAVTEDELNGALDTIKAIKDSRFPKTVKAARKPRVDKGSTRPTRTPTSTPTASSATEPSSSES